MSKKYYKLHKEEVKKRNREYYYIHGKYSVPNSKNKKPFDINNFDPAKAERFLGMNLSITMDYGKYSVPNSKNKKPFDVNSFDPAKAERFLGINLSFSMD
jgi:hypothetical protein